MSVERRDVERIENFTESVHNRVLMEHVRIIGIPLSLKKDFKVLLRELLEELEYRETDKEEALTWPTMIGSHGSTFGVRGHLDNHCERSLKEQALLPLSAVVVLSSCNAIRQMTAWKNNNSGQLSVAFQAHQLKSLILSIGDCMQKAVVFREKDMEAIC
ncbi:unnamed protein product [Nippostrongylus brasiliensis]|uniref:CHAT domain-containing protein n=1 Tax=Nippostrongylus brasiliensis TaxID=27835 RepID=A0A0N4YSA7_NIPBR|nr:unnamed protein product [Nippostrongylus brasiliensis]